MLKEEMSGFCMALADSVPGVSGGTVAFIMGFYDQFIGFIHNLVFGKLEEKKTAAMYLVKLGTGWAVGMLMAVTVLSALFESYIYAVSSLFIGFIAGAIPIVIKEEKQSLQENTKDIFFCLAGILLVAGITWANCRIYSGSMDLGQFSISLAFRLFLIGMIAVSAMFLPGISGSTLLLIFGAYIPVVTAVKGLLSFNFSYIPCLMFFGCGVLAGAVTVVKGIKICLERFRPQTIYMILGMMAGSFYAVIMGPAALEKPQAALSPGNFNIISAVIGVVLVFGMQIIKERSVRNEN